MVDLVAIEGAEHIEAVARLGRGGMLVSGHFGNWELLGARVAAEGRPVNFIIKTQHNERVDRLQNEIRRGVGIGTIRAGASIKEMILALRAAGVDRPAGRPGRRGRTGCSASSWAGRPRCSAARPTWPGS